MPWRLCCFPILDPLSTSVSAGRCTARPRPWLTSSRHESLLQLNLMPWICKRSAPIDVAPLFLDHTLDELLAHEHARIETCLLQLDENQREVFAALPTHECLEWQFCSGVLHAFVRQYAVSPTQCGVTVDGSDHNHGQGYGHAFLLWAHDLRASTLYILYASLPDDAPRVALRLLREALDEAHRFGLRHIKVWDPPCGGASACHAARQRRGVRTPRRAFESAGVQARP